MSEESPTWAIEAVKREASRRRADLRLWGKANAILHNANALIHLIEEPPPGFDSVSDMGQARGLAVQICLLCTEIIDAIVIEAKEADHARND